MVKRLLNVIHFVAEKLFPYYYENEIEVHVESRDFMRLSANIEVSTIIKSEINHFIFLSPFGKIKIVRKT